MEIEETCKSLLDDYMDYLSDVPVELDDSEERGGHPENELSDIEFSDDSEAHMQRTRQILSLLSYSEESDEGSDTEWIDLDPPRDNNVFEGSSGFKVLPNDTENVEAFADLFIGNDLLEFICTETNKYYIQSSDKNKQYKKCGKFYNVTIGELKKWFALLILMGLIKKPRMDDFWSTNQLLETPIFRKTMSRNRFRQILTFIHFCDNSIMPKNADRLVKVQPIIDYFSVKFRESYEPGQNISIDESVIPWRGGLHYKGSDPVKINKYGILIRTLCDATTGYVSCFKIYPGADQASSSPITELLQDSFGKWHHLYADNYHNSVELVSYLFKNKMGFCGTIQRNRGLPSNLESTKLQCFETAFKRKGEILVQLWKPSKSKIVRMISTIHNAEVLYNRNVCKKTNQRIHKPKSIMDYNQFTKGVHRADKYLNYYPVYKKNIKWSTKVVLYLFNCALFNAFRMHQHFNVTSKNLQFYDFLLKLCEAWLTDNVSESEEISEVPTTSRAPPRDSAHRLSGQLKDHQLVKICETDKRKRRRCRVCTANKIRRTTYLMCKSCEVPLHIGECFASYHLKKKY